MKNGTYSPGAHGQIDSEQARIREMTLEMLDGRRPLPISITNIPQQKSGSDRVS
ncbi:DUF6680 family protein [Pseudomonas putida]|uniref:DUF6680 family protein n=1 Tax=Pseudomonas putida TaxID=303 RepID=UPI0038579E8B